MFERLQEAINAYGRNVVGIVLIGGTHLLDHGKTVFGLSRAAGHDCVRVWLHEQV